MKKWGRIFSSDNQAERRAKRMLIIECLGRPIQERKSGKCESPEGRNGDEAQEQSGARSWAELNLNGIKRKEMR